MIKFPNQISLPGSINLLTCNSKSNSAWNAKMRDKAKEQLLNVITYVLSSRDLFTFQRKLNWLKVGMILFSLTLRSLRLIFIQMVALYPIVSGLLRTILAH